LFIIYSNQTCRVVELNYDLFGTTRAYGYVYNNILFLIKNHIKCIIPKTNLQIMFAKHIKRNTVCNILIGNHLVGGVCLHYFAVVIIGYSEKKGTTKQLKLQLHFSVYLYRVLAILLYSIGNWFDIESTDFIVIDIIYKGILYGIVRRGYMDVDNCTFNNSAIRIFSLRKQEH